ncbi:nicotinamide-nucleotide amidohydrolase family protein [Candidatus Aerophobetes bacterium]|nr:nicotinamide-nucleotide amidohydrolase family protein [Candidatus Aerophobetes bacterium]
MKDYIYGVDEETLEGVVASLLIKKGLTISVAESCTGGLVSHRLTNISGSSNYYKCGIISYSNQAKSAFLKVNNQLIKEKGAVSPEVVKEMAVGIRTSAHTDIGLGITGIAGPTGTTPTKPVGLVYIALSSEAKQINQKFIFSGNREQIKWKASQTALDILRKYLLGAVS